MGGGPIPNRYLFPPRFFSLMTASTNRLPAWVRELAWVEGWVSLLLLTLVLAVALVMMIG